MYFFLFHTLFWFSLAKSQMVLLYFERKSIGHMRLFQKCMRFLFCCRCLVVSGVVVIGRCRLLFTFIAYVSVYHFHTQNKIVHRFSFNLNANNIHTRNCGCYCCCSWCVVVTHSISLLLYVLHIRSCLLFVIGWLIFSFGWLALRSTHHNDHNKALSFNICIK